MRKYGLRKPFSLTTVLLLALLSVVIGGCATSDGGTTPAPTPTVPSPTSTPHEVTLSYEIVDSNLRNYYWKPTTECSLKIENTNEVSALFRIEFNLTTEKGLGVTKVVWQALEPDERKEITIRYDEGYVDSFTYSITPQVLNPAPTPVSSPAPTTVVQSCNISRKLSGLDYALTMVHWTGNEVMAEWAIKNNTGQKVDRSRLNTIFTQGIAAVDQAGNEGEYFIPEPFQRHLYHGDFKTYETRWTLYPESKVITFKLSDIFTDGIVFVDTFVEFVITR
jgi:hypothetical protein